MSGRFPGSWFRLAGPNLWLLGVTVGAAALRRDLGWLRAPGRHGRALRAGVLVVAAVVLGAALPVLRLGAPGRTPPPVEHVLLLTLVPLSEELYFRGLLLVRLRALLGPAGAVGTTSLVFALLHLPQGSHLQMAGLAVALGAVTVWSGAVGWAVLLHAAWNGVALLRHLPPGHRLLAGGLLAALLAGGAWWLGRRALRDGAAADREA